MCNMYRKVALGSILELAACAPQAMGFLQPCSAHNKSLNLRATALPPTPFFCKHVLSVKQSLRDERVCKKGVGGIRLVSKYMSSLTISTSGCRHWGDVSSNLLRGLRNQFSFLYFRWFVLAAFGGSNPEGQGSEELQAANSGIAA